MPFFDPETMAGLVRGYLDRQPQPPEPGFNPTRETITELLRCAFLTSLRTEERRVLRFTLLFAPPNDGPSVFQFVDPRPLTVDGVRRLAVAASFPTGEICVRERDGQCELWGTQDVTLDRQLLESAEQSSGAVGYTGLAITVTGPGSMVLSYRATVILELAGGEVAPPRLNVFKFGPIHDFFEPAIKQLLLDAFPENAEFRSDAFTFVAYGGEYLRLLVRVLLQAQTSGHGGAIFVVPHTDAERVGTLLSVKYATEGRDVWQGLVGYLVSVRDEIEASKLLTDEGPTDGALVRKWKDHSKRVRQTETTLLELSRGLANLTQVDGGVVLTDRFRLVGFGAVVEEVSSSEVGVCVDEYGTFGKACRADAFGTRHRSAIALCEKLDCAAFVLSQDGGVKALRRVGAGPVALWPSVSLHISAWAPTAADVIPALRPPRGGLPSSQDSKG